MPRPSTPNLAVRNPHYFKPGLPYKEAATEETYRQAGHDFQRYVAENMIVTSAASVPFLQAARTYVKGYEHLHGYKIRFETTWLEK